MKLLKYLFESRFWALTVKEIQQILHNKQSIFLLIFPPTIQLIIFGLSLSPDVNQLSLGVIDYARTQESRQLVSSLTENKKFVVESAPERQQELTQQVRQGEIITGLIIPPDFSRNLNDGKTSTVQVFIDGIDANTAGIAQGYIKQIIREYNRTLSYPPPVLPIETEVIFLYNPGLISSYFFVPGVIGLVLTLTSSLVSSVTIIREKDVGTLEQLLMTPAAGWEILLAKIVPLFVLLMGDVLLASGIARLVFRLPFLGNFLLFLILSGLYILVSISIGILLATLARNQQQVILISFFFNMPIIQLSGAIAPIESMPPFFQILSLFNPLRHYVKIARSIILKGVGLEVIWFNAIALICFAIVLLSISTRRFRSQL